MKYYHNNKRVWEIEDSVDMSSYPTFVLLTAKQRNFYKKYPAASLQEVLSGELYVHPTPSLDGYKANKIAEMSELSKTTALQKYPQYVRDNIFLGVYDDTEAQLTAMRTYFIAMRKEFYRVKELIDIAVSVEELDEICTGQNFMNL